MIIRRNFLCGLIFLLIATWLSATTVVPPNFDELVNRSDYVVRARVTSSESELRVSGPRRRIFTKVGLDVLEVIVGQPPAKLVLEFLGGRIGDEEMIVDGMPRLKVGEESVLFIKGNGRTLCPIYAMSYGIYPIHEEPATKRRYVSRENKQPLESVAEVAQPLSKDNMMDVPQLLKKRANALTPDEFTDKIRGALKPPSGRAIDQ